MSDEDRIEKTANLENKITEAVMTLTEEYDYSREDIENVVEDALKSVGR